MNVNRIFTYIVIAIPLLFLTKCGVESVVYNSNKTPDINPNPKEKLRVFGKFPFEDDVKMEIAIHYMNKNPKCDKKIWLAGTQFPQQRIRTFVTKINKGVFESNVYLDSFLSGICQWEAYNIYAHMQSKRDDMTVGNETIKKGGKDITYIPIGAKRKDNMKTLEYAGIRKANKVRIGTIAFENFQKQGKPLDVECKREKRYKDRASLFEVSWTSLECYYINEDNRVRRASELLPNVLSSQKIVEINFIDKGWEK